MLRKFLIVLCTLLLSFVPANSREITNGTVTVPGPAIFVAFVMNFSGTDFSVAAVGSNLGGIAFAPCIPLRPCTPGTVISLSAFSGQWGFSDVSGTMTIDGTQYFLVNRVFPTLPSVAGSGSVSFSGGSVTIPISGAPIITLKAPFVMSGFLSGRADRFLGIGLPFSGSGTAFLTIKSGGIGDQKVYLLQSLIYRFGSPVNVDIKPGDEANNINPRSRGKVPVAILSTEAFDASTINPLTVTVAGARVDLKPNGTPMASLEDVNNDGLVDLVIHVNTAALKLTNLNEEVLVEGKTFDGKFFWGTDTIAVAQ